jgi:hypoxanthine phosphoribosyltransferase
MRLSEPLFHARQIQARVHELGQAINSAYADRDLVVITVLKGSVVFAADLLRTLRRPVELEFIRAKSYAGASSTRVPIFTWDPESSLRGRHLLLVEDILDTGRTAHAILARLQGQQPASLAICTLLDKPSRRQVTVEADFVGFTIDDHFVVGYGMDYEERYRELPDIRVLHLA